MGTDGNGESLGARAFGRVSHPLSWSTVDRCLLCCVVSLFFLGWGVYVVNAFLAQRPELAPYLDHSTIARLFPVNVAFIGGWCVFVIAGLALRRRSPENRLLLYAVSNTLP